MADRDSIFSADALRARRAKPLNLPSYFLKLPSAIGFIFIFISTAMGLLWAIFAKIPINVPGYAVVVNINDVKPMITKSSGRIHVITPSISATRTIIDKQIYSFYNSNSFDDSLDNLITLTNSVLYDTSPYQFTNLSRLTKNANILNTIATSQFSVKKGQVVTIVFNEEERSLLSNKLINLSKEYSTNLSTINRNRKNLSAFKEQKNNQKKMIESFSELARIGAISKLHGLEEVSKYDNLLMKIRNTENDIELIGLRNKSITTSLRSALISYINSVYVFSESDGYISNIAKGNEQYAENNQPILFFSNFPSSSLPPLIVGFSDERSANLITPGMKVIATPEGVNKSQYGGIKGVISTKLPYTMTSKRLSGIVGIDSIGSIAKGNITASNLLTIKLFQEFNGEGYKWTTSQKPPVRTGIGDVLNLTIEVDSQSPLMMALPAIKKYTGLEGPTDFIQPR